MKIKYKNETLVLLVLTIFPQKMFAHQFQKHWFLMIACVYLPSGQNPRKSSM